jgi:hypothetical protein
MDAVFYSEMEFLILSTEEIKSSVIVSLSPLQWGTCYYCRQAENKVLKRKSTKSFNRIPMSTRCSTKSTWAWQQGSKTGQYWDHGTKTWSLEDGQRTEGKSRLQTNCQSVSSVLNGITKRKQLTMDRPEETQYLSSGQLSFLTVWFQKEAACWQHKVWVGVTPTRRT